MGAVMGQGVDLDEIMTMINPNDDKYQAILDRKLRELRYDGYFYCSWSDGFYQYKDNKVNFISYQSIIKDVVREYVGH